MIFSDLRACCGAAGFTPAADPPRQDPNSAGNNRASSRRPLRRDSSVNWKPALSAISEDAVIASDDRFIRESKGTVIYQETTKSTAIAPPYTCHGDEYRRESSWTMLPSFSPMPFMF